MKIIQRIKSIEEDYEVDSEEESEGQEINRIRVHKSPDVELADDIEVEEEDNENRDGLEMELFQI